MTDIEVWEMGVAAVTKEYDALASPVVGVIREHLKTVKALKREIQFLAEKFLTGEICAVCGGECCVTGKHHFSVIDLLVYIADGRSLIRPRFANGLCPYLDECGCLMEPEYRPFNCVIFNCDKVEALFDPLDKERLYETERKLLAVYGELEELFDNRFMHGLLINCERDLLQSRSVILRGITVTSEEKREN